MTPAVGAGPAPVTPAVAYLRVSVGEADGLGLSAQRATITRECKARAWSLEGEYVDAGVSAVARHRPGLDGAVAAVAARKGAVLVVSRLDRLARSLGDYAGIVARSEREGWRLVALDAPDADTPTGEAMQGMTAIFAQLERRLIGQRTREALAAAKARGIRLGPPLLVDPETVARILELRRRRRMTASGIAALLAGDGTRAPAGGGWHPATVAAILRRAGITLPRGRPPLRRGRHGRTRAHRNAPERAGDREPDDPGGDRGLR